MRNSGLATIDAGLRWRMLIIRSAGLDPDGRLVPMGHNKVGPVTPQDCERAAARAERDAALFQALQWNVRK